MRCLNQFYDAAFDYFSRLAKPISQQNLALVSTYKYCYNARKTIAKDDYLEKITRVQPH
jgi:hypothetical protein